ncbi:MAG: zinc metallopeptidase [Clostridioides sp.]|jgi:Zn-dependent membrane protease YugP|nr:zinc metallopeptidase [Clostridioides sp.]
MFPMYYGGYGYDSTMIILIPAILLTVYAQYKVNSATKKYMRVRAHSGYTGEQAAMRILMANGLGDVKVEPIRGHLTDHYDPRTKVLRLSEDVYGRSSITSVAVAAHECGHAIQHAHGYAPLAMRSSLVPVVNFASNISWFLIIAGLMMSGSLLNIGIILFSVTVLFQIITLPVEFNASHRALIQLEELGIVDRDERRQSRSVLSAAAFTYVAAALVGILQLLRLILLQGRRRD